MACLNCGNELTTVAHKREKVFCNSTCRSNYWQKVKRLEGAGFSTDEIIKKMTVVKKKDKKIENKSKVKPSANNQSLSGKHELWKEGDPAEYSSIFYFKYDCNTYE